MTTKAPWFSSRRRHQIIFVHGVPVHLEKLDLLPVEGVRHAVMIECVELETFCPEVRSHDYFGIWIVNPLFEARMCMFLLHSEEHLCRRPKRPCRNQVVELFLAVVMVLHSINEHSYNDEWVTLTPIFWSSIYPTARSSLRAGYCRPATVSCPAQVPNCEEFVAGRILSTCDGIPPVPGKPI